MRQTVIFLVCLILCSYALSKRLEIEEILTRLVELNQVVGKDHEEVGVLISRVSSTMKDSFDLNAKMHNGIKANCDLGSGVLQDFINQLQMDSTSIDAEMATAENDSTKAQGDADKSSFQIEGLKSDISSFKTEIEKEIANFKVFEVASEHKLMAIKNIKDIFNDELLSPSKSFVQLQSRDFGIKLADLKNKLSVISAKESMYSPIATTLIALAENKNFADQKLLRNIIEIFSKLEKNLISFKEKHIAEQKKIIKDLKIKVNSARDQMKTLVSMLNEAQSTVIASKTITKSGEFNKKVIGATIDRKNKEFEYWGKVCEYQNKVRVQGETWRDSFSEKVRKVTSTLGLSE